MHHMRRAELAHARWKSRRLLAVVYLSFVGETNCSQGIGQEIDPEHWVHMNDIFQETCKPIMKLLKENRNNNLVICKLVEHIVI